ncbi:hypothetical protein B0H21DRAFT_759940 [Amylocystis lapponica]|nr:hypothetical protein B0H21DRAFT_759940 [Amylocystis lapponica]
MSANVTDIFQEANDFLQLLNDYRLARALWTGSAPSNFAVSIWAPVMASYGVVAQLCSTIISILRLHAMFGCSKKWLIVLCTCGFLTIAADTTIIAIIVQGLQGTAVNSPSTVNGCTLNNVDTYAWAIWLPQSLFEIGLLSLAIFRIIHVFRSDTRCSDMMFLLLRDSLASFIQMPIYLSSIIIWKFSTKLMFLATIPFAFVAVSIVGCRQLLNIRESPKLFRENSFPQHSLPSPVSCEGMCPSWDAPSEIFHTCE